MNRRKTWNRITLMIFNSSFDLFICEISSNLVFRWALLFIKFFHHTLDNATNRELQLFLNFFLVFFALSFYGSFIELSKICKNLPNQKYLLFSIFWKRSPKRFDHIFALLRFLINLFKNTSQMRINILLENFC